MISRAKGFAKQHLKSALRSALRSGDGRQPGLAPSCWGLLETAPGKGLALDGEALVDLTERFGSPLHVVSAARLRENARAYQAPFGESGAACEIYYSYKTNPVPAVLRTLHAAGVGAEVISPYELWLAAKLGVPASKIIYNGPAKSRESVRFAIELGIELLNCNHREEIAQVAEIARELGKKLRVGIRVAGSTGWSSQQFGVPVSGGEALAAYAEALQYPELEVVGLHAHRGGMIRDADAAGVFIDDILGFVKSLRQELGLTLEMLDFGGSLGSPTVRSLSPRDRRLNQTFQRDIVPPDPKAALSIGDYVALVGGKVEAHFRTAGLPLPRVVLEPGRSMTSNTQVLLATVQGIKAAEPNDFLILDAGINLAESARGEYHQLLTVNRCGEPTTRHYTVVGPICSPGDTLYASARLPELQRGDTLAIMDAGAYLVPFATSFSFPQPAIVMIDSGEVQEVRRAERFEDLVAYDLEDGRTPDGAG